MPGTGASSTSRPTSSPTRSGRPTPMGMPPGVASTAGWRPSRPRVRTIRRCSRMGGPTSSNGSCSSAQPRPRCGVATRAIDSTRQGQHDDFSSSSGAEWVNLAFPGLLLRLADIMDFDASRTPRIL